jgi:hypothetical protein
MHSLVLVQPAVLLDHAAQVTACAQLLHIVEVLGVLIEPLQAHEVRRAS